jgi:hypothetical protein|tara:strand:- start:476 stop:715 length:240 start_codon:yes stop_codon:yes gene_type:complete
MDISVIPDYITTKEDAINWLHRHGWGDYEAQLMATKWDEGIPLPDSILGTPKKVIEDTKNTKVKVAPTKKVINAPVKKI